MPKRSIPAVLLAFASLLIGPAGHAETRSAVGDGPSTASPLAAVDTSPEANLFSGSMAMTIPIQVPPGRANAAAGLALRDQTPPVEVPR